MADPRSGTSEALTRLTAASRALTYAASLDEVLQITVDCAADLLEAERVVLMMSDQEGFLRIRASRGVDPELAERFRESLDETLITRLGGVLGPDAAEGFLGVPLVVRGAVTGLLAILGHGGEQPTEHDEWLLSALADQASVALEGARHERTRADLERRLDRLEREGTYREDALRIVGHDLKSPLSALNGYLHLLRTEAYGSLNEGQLATIERLGSITAHVNSLVDSVLDMGRLATGSLQIDCQDLELAPIIGEAVTVLGPAPGADEVSLVTHVPEGLQVHANRDRLRQVLVHLMDNALKHAPAESEVTVTAEPQGGDVIIRVRDHGPGIPPELAEEVFEPYRRLDGETSGGMGLGLAIGRGLVERMGGSLAVDTEVADGAAFVVRLRS